MTDETQSSPEKKMNLVDKVIIGGCGLCIALAIGLSGYLYGRHIDQIKNIATRDVNNDYKEDLIITHESGEKDAFIKQTDSSYITWYEARKKLYKSLDDSVDQIEKEIKK